MNDLKNIKVTTTSILQNVDIEEYIDTIYVSTVVGMNIFKDITSGLTDFFGGKSNSYIKTLEKINREAIYELRKKANYLNANYIIGLSITNEEISGQGKSMIMVTAFGTAVRVAIKGKNIINNATSIGLEVFHELEIKNQLLRDLENGDLNLNENNWGIIIENRISELSNFLLTEFLKSPDSGNFKEKIRLFFESLDKDSAIKELNQFIKSNSEKDLKPIIDVIKDLNLVNLEVSLSLLADDNKNLNFIGAILSGIHKKVYFNSDIPILIKCLDIINEKFPKKVEYTKIFDDFSRKEINIWTCECGTVNSSERNVCRKCPKDIYGFKPSILNITEVRESLNHRIHILEKNFNIPQNLINTTL